MKLKSFLYSLLLTVGMTYADDLVKIDDNYSFKKHENTSNEEFLESTGVYSRPIAKREEDSKRFYTASETSGLGFCFADWDGDGLEDLITTSAGNVYVHKNTGQKDQRGIPVYEDGLQLHIRLPFVRGRGGGIAVKDINGDGKLDIVYSAGDSFIYFYLNKAK